MVRRSERILEQHKPLLCLLDALALWSRCPRLPPGKAEWCTAPQTRAPGPTAALRQWRQRQDAETPSPSEPRVKINITGVSLGCPPTETSLFF